ncbi:SDR family NAD(P)-dependent oxidoreductase [Nocardia cyriacigeorgica]|uniref:SDR family NAD(P)-dependent oxidoreductase n=1 Tax=Nocardia cyriacigeorgica TaxID=135487 RepID=A0A6P1D4I2_9NOCA|nr:SDR family NAD(P)-dependent oxidoreductase [Nocardia cyriacigeorgica]NEW38309.1 SDR family NAD(P)-dependent oxidoreductase [Nocardia cyriacigeorgica]NEW44344.1 SDR family NAD(P)-dependent oxidoreductase [Nocardia cyriacigeorgica]NEW49252.1 SDR family NAD(P)-dependent oxidoreductase [Nocardia cyriacigeorgica]NEW58418.1 SDR family NAD(P)-dependent oxidoreductase [Nocardia cyriacigeorgica]
MTSIFGGSVAGRRVLITGAARGIGAALARQLFAHGAEVALLGLEPELLGKVARECGDAPWRYCDVSDRAQVDAGVEAVVGELGGLDVVVANAGVAKQLPLIGGDPVVMEQTIAVNVLGVYYTVRAAGPHISHSDGYALVVSSLAAAVHLPLLGAYSASKAGVEALGDTLRHELRHTGAKVGVAYFAELDTDMTSRGFGTEAARSLLGKATVSGVAPLGPAIDAVERAIARRRRRVVSPWWVTFVLPFRPIAQRVTDLGLRRGVADALRIARTEATPFTTEQPTHTSRMDQHPPDRTPE